MACTPSSEDESLAQTKIEMTEFGVTQEGDSVHLYTLTNDSGMVVKITNYGGIITDIHVPDREGEMGNVVLGFDEMAKYEAGHPYFGAIIGRYGNRIDEGEFVIDDATFTLAKNNGPNSLHGGEKGFDKQVWETETFEDATGVGLKMSYVSEDGEEGFPGKLMTTVTYTLTDDNALRIDYEAQTDKKTVLNLTNHTYFNLKDGGASDILDHVLMIAADEYTPVDSTMIPTGELRSVEDTPFDFRNPTPIGERIDVANQQLDYGEGYDHNYVLTTRGDLSQVFATVYDPVSGRLMECYTSQPGVQLYTGNQMDGSLVGPDGVRFNRRSGLCLETQHFPDSPNQPDFPTTLLEPGDTYSHTTMYKFSVRE